MAKRTAARLVLHAYSLWTSRGGSLVAARWIRAGQVPRSCLERIAVLGADPLASSHTSRRGTFRNRTVSRHRAILSSSRFNQTAHVDIGLVLASFPGGGLYGCSNPTAYSRRSAILSTCISSDTSRTGLVRYRYSLGCTSPHALFYPTLKECQNSTAGPLRRQRRRGPAVQR